MFHRDDGTCKHVICLLFSLADYWEHRKDRHQEVCTDTPMTWTKPRKESVPVKASQLDYRKNKATPRKPRPIPEEYRPVRDMDLDAVLAIRENIRSLCQRERPGKEKIKSMRASTKYFKYLSIHVDASSLYCA